MKGANKDHKDEVLSSHQITTCRSLVLTVKEILRCTDTGLENNLNEITNGE